MKSVVALSLVLASALAMTGCVVGGAGGGGGAAQTGGLAGATCNPAVQGQGCLGTKRMQCDEPTQKWVEIDACGAGTYCAESAADAQGKRTATCKASPTAQIDTTGGDTTAGGDAVTTGDVTAADINVGVLMACMQSKCASQWAACQLDSGCKKFVDCFVAKPGDEEACLQGVGASSLGLVQALGECGEVAECLPSTKPACGNGTCDAGETPNSCAQDCKQTGPVCGNTVCESGETTSSCPQDCKQSGPVCGNGVCESGETKTSCAKDCGTVSAAGDCSGSIDYNTLKSTGYSLLFSNVAQKCVISAGCMSQSGAAQTQCLKTCIATGGFGLSESCSTCIANFAQCTVGACMDKCAANPADQLCQNCAQSACGSTLTACGAPPATSTGPVCGNGKCESGETKTNCAKDCGATGPVCGNGACESTESNSSCPSDCKAVCGNGKCESGESQSSCSKDCGTTGPVCGDFQCSSGENISNCEVDCDPGNQCLFAACGGELNTCMMDSACAGIFTCIDGCGSSTTCQQSCLTSTSSTTQSLFMAFANCANASGCSGGGTCGDGTCDAGESSSNCPADCKSGGGSGGAGCTPKSTPKCNGCSCEACVCKLDPYCCSTGWDSTCVGECSKDCGATCP